MSDRYAVIGNPIEHSKSPQIHQGFAKQTKQDLIYEKIQSDDFVKTAQAFFAEGGKGLNITVPFKEAAFQFADKLSPIAKQAGAVNTLKKEVDGSIFGDNTDGIGLIRDLVQNNSCPLAQKNILILGVGGAARGVIPALFNENPAQITIANRTVEKATQLAQHFADLNLVACGYNELAGQYFDCIINATSASLTGDVPAIPKNIIKIGGLTYDMMYSIKPTAFVLWGRNTFASQSIDGLGMLVEQAAEAFYLWRGIRPETKDAIRLLRH